MSQDQNENAPNSLSAQQAQQIASSQPSPEGVIMSQQPQVATEETAINTQLVESNVEVVRTPTIADLLGADSTSVFKIQPRFLLTFTPRAYDTLPDKVVIHGNYYNLRSPLATGEGSAAKPFGIVREGFANAVKYLSELSASTNLSYFGKAADADFAVQSLSEQIANTVQSIFLEFNNGSDTFDIPENGLKDYVHAVSEDGSLDVNSEVEYVEIDVSNIFNVVVSPTLSVLETGTVININVNVNVVIPRLVDSDTPVKDIRIMHRIGENYARSFGIGTENFRSALVLDSSNLLNADTQKLIASYSEEGVVADVVNYGYFEQATANNEDRLEILPIGTTAPDAFNSVFAFGGDLLIIAASFPKEAVPVAQPTPVLKKKKKLLKRSR